MESTGQYGPLRPYYVAALEEAEARQQAKPVWTLDVERDTPVTLHSALTATDDVAVIAEHKRRSPSEGEIRPDSSVEWAVTQYALGGAVAVSVLTQHKHFGGDVEDIGRARDTSEMPILRKDFIDDPYQLYEAKDQGAAAMLLIMAGLNRKRMLDLSEEAKLLHLEYLVEVHDEDELKEALLMEAPLIGVNNRNLSTLEVDLGTADRLIPQIPDGIVTVAESGYSVRDPDHIRRLRELGADAVLMGTALMREPHPSDALASWLATP